MLAAIGILAVLGIIGVGTVVASPAALWVYPINATLALLAVYVFARIWNVKLRYDATSLFVTGLLWSRTIPRRSITRVDRVPNDAWVTWTDSSGRTRMTPLTPVWGNNWGWLPANGAKRRREFLTRLARWARS